MAEKKPNKKPVEVRWWWHWRHYAAFVYLFICIFDFVVMPLIFEHSNKHDVQQLVEFALKFKDSAAQIKALDMLSAKRAWEPLTLMGSGFFHMSFGAILGVAAYSRGLDQNMRTRAELGQNEYNSEFIDSDDNQFDNSGYMPNRHFRRHRRKDGGQVDNQSDDSGSDEYNVK